ncbi:MAG: hypothetical protein JWM48_2861 [Mycobacterium sp.]|nr:hypothetical protein [Mycobacterium sp.]
MAILGLVLIIVGGVFALVVALSNAGSDNLVQGFQIFGADVHISSGRVFFLGIVAGVVLTAGVFLTVGALTRLARRRGERKRLRRDADATQSLAAERDELAVQRDTLAAERDRAVEERDQLLAASATGSAADAGGGLPLTAGGAAPQGEEIALPEAPAAAGPAAPNAATHQPHGGGLRGLLRR